MKVLHITCWFPSSKNPGRAVFIKKQIETLNEFAENKILHFEIVKSKAFKIERFKSKNLEQTILFTPLYIWTLVELIHFFWLYRKLILQRKHQKYDIINFHIAYPMLIYLKIIKKKVKTPILISEHWSAYKSNFGVKKDLNKIKNIFCQNIPVSAVSQVLIQDIESFSSCKFKSYVIPNVVDSTIFYPSELQKSQKEKFLMCSFWKAPKKPLIVLEAFKSTLKTNPNVELNIIGDGPLKFKMEKWISDNNLGSKIHLLGTKNSKEIAEIMRDSDIFLHPSEYETFSVVCAEAMACGLPIIASNVGAISEVIKDSGILVENNLESWSKAINEALNSKTYASSNLAKLYDTHTVGKLYFDTLNNVIDETE